MKNVGILTFHYVHNFGAVLQSWALSSAIRELGHQVTVIDYRPPDAHTMQSRRGLRALLPSLGKTRMDYFVRRHIPLSPRRMTKISELESYCTTAPHDVLVCGSDQVWLAPENRPFEPAYFLDVPVPPTVRRASYAPSSGPQREFGTHRDRVASALTRFDAISVRDSNTMAAVDTLGTGPVTRVLDPTMIADFTPLLSSRSNADYIAVVGKTDAAAERYIRFAARTLGLPVIGFGTRCKAADFSRPFVSPNEWLSGIAGARLVITSLFHGAAISLALRRPFIALDCGGRAFKLDDLCTHCGIPERLLMRATAENYFQDAALFEMDYTNLSLHLETLAKSSRTYLREALDG